MKPYKVVPDVNIPFIIMRGDKPIEHCLVENEHGTMILTNGVDRDTVVTCSVLQWLEEVVQSGRVFHKE